MFSRQLKILEAYLLALSQNFAPTTFRLYFPPLTFVFRTLSCLFFFLCPYISSRVVDIDTHTDIFM